MICHGRLVLRGITHANCILCWRAFWFIALHFMYITFMTHQNFKCYLMSCNEFYLQCNKYESMRFMHRGPSGNAKSKGCGF